MEKDEVHPFQPFPIVFDDISYKDDIPPKTKEKGVIKNRLQLLRNARGPFRLGILMTLVGVSGAGKTTLMDVWLEGKLVYQDPKCIIIIRIERTPNHMPKDFYWTPYLRDEELS